MTEKRKLLLKLRSALTLEEDFIVRLVPITQNFLIASELLEKEKDEIESILSVLKSDSAGHKRVVEGLIKESESGRKDGHKKDTI